MMQHRVDRSAEVGSRINQGAIEVKHQQAQRGRWNGTKNPEHPSKIVDEPVASYSGTRQPFIVNTTVFLSCASGAVVWAKLGKALRMVSESAQPGTSIIL